jgi:glycopeptide antibiotics resistance protein
MLIGAKLIDNDKLKRINITIWSILYLFVLLSLTLLNDYFYRGNKLLIFNQKYLNYYLEYYVNLKPFKMINSLISAYNNGYLSLKYLLINIGGNLILFTPFAFFLPRLFNKQKKFFIFFITISIIIIIIELLQLITFSGTCDIDDYILNITGSIISFCIFNNKYVYKILDKIIY